ncbi:hypothetical protein APUTEX25_002215 [Auxenochlorella protothecoides]|uniref:tRNA-specific adenosine deaminase n=1 Tax=Auxenochlorella protothecoides TaxID=3075 RepID=A0A3M7KYD4_AUXPR|nr:hypothetical protein APUTEX25_002215 [Auxenochlorella protothecoides]|eukprot:RMZ55357.1 hypothetical protein APUTEX25_002215 [Auxenochlorella protothecoides]
MAPSRRASPDHRRCTFEAVPPGYDSCPPLEAGLDSHYMRLALDQAHKAASKGEVPIGAVRGGVLADECQRLMVEFFRARRRGEVRGPPGAGSPVQREAS